MPSFAAIFARKPRLASGYRRLGHEYWFAAIRVLGGIAGCAIVSFNVPDGRRYIGTGCTSHLPRFVSARH